MCRAITGGVGGRVGRAVDARAGRDGVTGDVVVRVVEGPGSLPLLGLASGVHAASVATTVRKAIPVVKRKR
jgi:hypothetical protein